MYCTKCGHKLEEDSRYCDNCGNPVAAPAIVGQEKPGNRAVVYTSASTGQSKVFLILLILAVVAAGFIIYNMYFADNPAKVVEKFINAINEKDINTAITCMDPMYEKLYNATSNILSKFTGGVKIKDVVDTFPALFEFSRINGNPVNLVLRLEQVVSQQITGDSAVIVVALYGKTVDENGAVSEEKGESTFYLTKFNEGWRIVEFD